MFVKILWIILICFINYISLVLIYCITSGYVLQTYHLALSGITK